jgi:uncharacterized membrane protein
MDMSIEVDVKLDTKSMGGFLVYHNYSRASGLFSVLISVAALVGLIWKWDNWMLSQKVLLVILALLFTVIQPIMLVWRGSRQLQTEEFQTPFHYVFNENGIVISQKDQKQEFQWRDVRKIVYKKESIYVYMSTVSAFVLPKSQCSGRFDELVKMMRENKGK